MKRAATLRHKATILLSLTMLTAAGCEQSRQTLRRVEVWKQQTLFAPASASSVEFAGPMNAPATSFATSESPVALPSTAVSHGAASIGDGDLLPINGPTNEFALPSPEEVDGVLEQP